MIADYNGKGKVLYSTVSCPLGILGRAGLTVLSVWPLQSNTISTSLGSITPCCN